MNTKLTALMIVAAGAAGQPARAAVALKQVREEAGKVTLQFDRPVGGDHVQTEYFENTVQITFQDASVYPARISPIRSLPEVTKVFVYQYSPKVVRCRLTVKGEAATFKGRLQILRRGKEVAIRMKEESQDRLTAGASQALRKPDSGSERPLGLEADEQSLLEKILKRDEPPAAKAQAQQQQPPPPVPPTGSEGALPSPRKALVRLALLTLAMIGGALVFRWLRRSAAAPEPGRGPARPGVPGFLGSLGGSIERFAKGKLARARMIEVVSTHYLGPKKSIAVVRVAGRMMVLGVSQDSINLITRLEGDGEDGADLEAILDDAAIQSVHEGKGMGAVSAGVPRFNSVLAKEAAQPAIASNVPAAAAAAAAAQASAVPRSRVREQIRERLGGMKPL